MRISALFKRIVLQLIRDKRTLALLFVAPLLILTLMHLLFTSNDVPLRIGVIGGSFEIVERLEDQDFKVTVIEEMTTMKKLVEEQDLDGILKFDGQKLLLTLENADPSQTKMLQGKIQQVLSMSQDRTSIETAYVYGNKDTSFFDVLSPILVGFFVFFFVFLISGIGLLRERMTGTLEKLLSTPIKRWEIVSGYLLGYGLFAVIQTIIVVVYAVNILDMVLLGSMWHVLLINLLIALVALSLGILLSSFAASEFQMIQFIPLVIIPQVFFTGIIPISGMPQWLQGFSHVMPISYGANALKSVMYKGEGLGDVQFDLLALIGFAVVFIVLNIVALRKHRKT